MYRSYGCQLRREYQVKSTLHLSAFLIDRTLFLLKACQTTLTLSFQGNRLFILSGVRSPINRRGTIDIFSSFFLTPHISLFLPSFCLSIQHTQQNIMSLTATFRKEAEELVKEQMAAYDPSHDWLHVDRVRRQGNNGDRGVCAGTYSKH